MEVVHNDFRVASEIVDNGLVKVPVAPPVVTGARPRASHKGRPLRYVPSTARRVTGMVMGVDGVLGTAAWDGDPAWGQYLAGCAQPAAVVQNERHLHVNDAYVQLTGRSPSWLKEHGLSAVLSPCHR